MAVSTFPIPPKDSDDEKKHRRELANGLALSMLGRTNNVLDVEVTASSGTTTVTDSRIGVNTVAIAVPTNSNGQSAAVWPYRDFTSPVNGSMTLVHTNNGNSKTYKIILIG